MYIKYPMFLYCLLSICICSKAKEDLTNAIALSPKDKAIKDELHKLQVFTFE